MKNSRVSFRRSRPGFTLIELMIVIGIIAILAAILVPSFLRARAEGSLSACEQNLKALGTAVNAYAADNQGFLPLQNGESYEAGVIGTGGALDTLLQPYIMVTGIHCPNGPCSGGTQYFYEIDFSGWMNNPGQQTYQISHHGQGGPSGHGVLGLRDTFFPVWCENKKGSNDGINTEGL